MKVIPFSSYRHTYKHVHNFKGLIYSAKPTCRHWLKNKALPPASPTRTQTTGPYVLFCSHLYPQFSKQRWAHINVRCICHVTEFQWTMVVGGEVSELSLRAGHNHGIPSKSFLTVGQTHSSPPRPGLLTQTVSSHLSVAHHVPGTMLNALHFSHLICIKHLASAAVEKAGASWESNLRLSDFGDICFLQLSSPSP